jgi:hypothetical protein
MKKCTKCNIEKELSEYNKNKLYSDGHKTRCRECQKIESSIYREKNKEKINEKSRIQYLLNPQIQKDRDLKWKTNNLESYQKSNYERGKKWEEKNKDKRREYKNNYSTQKLKTDILFKLKRNVRIRINKFLKNKKDNSSDIVGCSYLYLKEHLEQNFKDNMSWDNYGEWHIDHIKPLSKFDLTKPEEFKQACHYTNLQPLWAVDNLRKGNR